MHPAEVPAPVLSPRLALSLDIGHGTLVFGIVQPASLRDLRSLSKTRLGPEDGRPIDHAPVLDRLPTLSESIALLPADLSLFPIRLMDSLSYTLRVLERLITAMTAVTVSAALDAGDEDFDEVPAPAEASSPPQVTYSSGLLSSLVADYGLSSLPFLQGMSAAAPTGGFGSGTRQRASGDEPFLDLASGARVGSATVAAAAAAAAACPWCVRLISSGNDPLGKHMTIRLEPVHAAASVSCTSEGASSPGIDFMFDIASQRLLAIQLVGMDPLFGDRSCHAPPGSPLRPALYPSWFLLQIQCPDMSGQLVLSPGDLLTIWPSARQSPGSPTNPEHTGPLSPASPGKSANVSAWISAEFSFSAEHHLSGVALFSSEFINLKSAIERLAHFTECPSQAVRNLLETFPLGQPGLAERISPIGLMAPLEPGHGGQSPNTGMDTPGSIAAARLAASRSGPSSPQFSSQRLHPGFALPGLTADLGQPPPRYPLFVDARDRSAIHLHWWSPRSASDGGATQKFPSEAVPHSTRTIWIGAPLQLILDTLGTPDCDRPVGSSFGSFVDNAADVSAAWQLTGSDVSGGGSFHPANPEGGIRPEGNPRLASAGLGRVNSAGGLGSSGPSPVAGAAHAKTDLPGDIPPCVSVSQSARHLAGHAPASRVLSYFRYGLEFGTWPSAPDTVGWIRLHTGLAVWTRQGPGARGPIPGANLAAYAAGLDLWAASHHYHYPHLPRAGEAAATAAAAAAAAAAAVASAAAVAATASTVGRSPSSARNSASYWAPPPGLFEPCLFRLNLHQYQTAPRPATLAGLAAPPLSTGEPPIASSASAPLMGFPLLDIGEPGSRPGGISSTPHSGSSTPPSVGSGGGPGSRSFSVSPVFGGIPFGGGTPPGPGVGPGGGSPLRHPSRDMGSLSPGSMLPGAGGLSPSQQLGRLFEAELTGGRRWRDVSFELDGVAPLVIESVDETEMSNSTEPPSMPPAEPVVSPRLFSKPDIWRYQPPAQAVDVRAGGAGLSSMRMGSISAWSSTSPPAPGLGRAPTPGDSSMDMRLFNVAPDSPSASPTLPQSTPAPVPVAGPPVVVAPPAAPPGPSLADRTFLASTADSLVLVHQDRVVYVTLF
ncbi:hypothetical protein H696_04640 [Fonticula alba]|uniref:Uncharacterized protein n=1 Tax=Fonticula alba TaxID=691883 RepID=A0A058Z5K2_FONAL|nr:hypothetical protein H696_04640 [Fonticula alba]KCV69223.1 hypothetical protein H696_04640 [Fonticula alba]|eukprot:XP_009496794.1 hypothetical protein H696_04640 [Fonticula alba]